MIIIEVDNRHICWGHYKLHRQNIYYDIGCNNIMIINIILQYYCFDDFILAFTLLYKFVIIL